MTCIVGLIDDGITYIGADSLGSNGQSKVVRLDRKVFKLKDTPNAIIGYTSSFRMGQLLMYATGLLDELAISKDLIDHEYLVTEFIPNVIDLFENGGYSKIQDNEKTGGIFLFAYKNNLYKVESDFQVEQSADNYNVVGCGEYFALGSLYSTKSLKPVERIHKALQAAGEYSSGVGAPYYIINTDNNKVVKFKD